MSETAAAQLRRILHIIPQLADDEPHSLSEIAARVGVDVETLRSDLWSLVSRFQDPGGFVEGVQLYLESDQVELVSNHFLRPMRLTASELCALELGLAMLRAERPPEEHSAIDRARERLRTVIAKLPADAIADGERAASLGAVGNVEHFAAVRAALGARRKLRIMYRRGDATEAGTRVICPYALVAASGMFYLVAYCTESEGLRIFRLDRVEDAAPLAERFEVPESFSLDAVLQDGKAFHAERPRTMRVRYSPRIARWIAEREGETPDADGSLTLEHPLADVAWAVRNVLQYGPDAEVLEPEDVREAVRAQLSALADTLASARSSAHSRHN